MVHYEILNFILGSISDEFIKNIIGVICIFDSNSVILHFILELNYPIILKLPFS